MLSLYHERLCVEVSHILLLIFRKSFDDFDRKLFFKITQMVIVYTIYSLLKPLHTVLTVSEKDNTITSSLILNSCSIKIVLLIDVFLSIDDYRPTLCFVLFCNVLCAFIYFMLFIFHYLKVCVWHTDQKATWLENWLENFYLFIVIYTSVSTSLKISLAKRSECEKLHFFVFL